MKYMGSKARIAKHLLPIILKDRKPDQWYVEPFVGGGNMIDKVDGNRIGADVNFYLIELLRAMASGWMPPKDLSELEYIDIKSNQEKYPAELVAYAGFQLSYGAMWFGSYRKDSQGSRNYSHEAFRNHEKQAPKLNGCLFECNSYKGLDMPPQSIVYCDPPYQGTAKYKGGDVINHDEFWQWCRDKCKEGHRVYVSEYKAPDDFVCVWSGKLKVSISKSGKQKDAIERLFVHKSQASV